MQVHTHIVYVHVVVFGEIGFNITCVVSGEFIPGRCRWMLQYPQLVCKIFQGGCTCRWMLMAVPPIGFKIVCWKLFLCGCTQVEI